MHVFVGSYLSETNRIINIFDLYGHLRDTQEEKIFFVGSSQIASGVDCSAIEEHISKSKNSNLQVYNVGYPGDTPLRRLSEVARLKECRPKMVFIGLTYYAINDTSFPISSDDLALVSGDIELDNYSRSLFQANDLSLLDMDQLSLEFYKRKFIVPSLWNVLNLTKKGTEETEAPKNFKIQPMNYENLTPELLSIRLNNSRDTLDKYVVGGGENVQKKALNHTLHLLNSLGNSVIIINMPLNPVLSREISEDTRRNYFQFLNSTGTNYYDYESRYPPNCFRDLTHLNSMGRKQFSEDMARMILKEERNL